MVQLVSVDVLSEKPTPLAKPPPVPEEELPLMVQLVSVDRAAIVGQAAAVEAGGVAADGAVGQRGRAAA